MTAYHYIIVGAGTAGCVLAERLTADPSVEVLLVENGGPDRHPFFQIPQGFYYTMRSPKYAYHYATEPVGRHRQTETWLRGNVAGGTSSINGMMYTRGHAADFDALAASGNVGWGWDTMLPVYRAIEDHQLGASSTRGAGGPVHISVADAGDEVTDAIMNSAQRRGWQRVRDTNEADVERIGPTPSTIAGGRRVSAATAFLRPARRRKNLTYLDRTRVGRLLLDGRRVVGVRARTAGTARDLVATEAVVVSAGTVESPLLLERSGIGSGDVLARAGVELKVESPYVGERIAEHRAVTVQMRLRDGLGINPLLNSAPRRVRAAAVYAIGRRGPIATGPYDLVSFFASSPDIDRPDVQGVWGGLATDPTADELRPAPYAGMTFVGYRLRPTTRSSVHIGGPEAEDTPIVTARYLETEDDREVTSRILQRARDVVSSGPLADLVLDEVVPGPGVSTPQEVVDYALDTGTGVYHAVGSCGMGPRDDDVVDDRLRVRGVDGLRVVDASVFPDMIAGNTAAPTLALAYRAADLIAAEGGH